MPHTLADIQKLYITYFNRPADSAGLNYWMNSSISLKDISNSFSEQTEYASLYAGLSNEKIIINIYQNLFGHIPDYQGLAYWLSEINAGRTTLGTAAFMISGGAKNKDKITIDSKVNAASALTNEVNSLAKVLAYETPRAKAFVKAWLDKISDNFSLNVALNSLDKVTQLLTEWQTESKDVKMVFLYAHSSITGIPNVKENFIVEQLAHLKNTSIAGNLSDNDILTLQDPGSIVINKEFSISDIKTLRLATLGNYVYFNDAKSGIHTIFASAGTDVISLTNSDLTDLLIDLDEGYSQVVALEPNKAYQGILTAGSGLEAVNLRPGTDISHLQFYNFEYLDLPQEGNVTISVNQLANMRILGGGETSNLSITVANGGDFKSDWSIPKYTLSDEGNTITLTSTGFQTINGGSADDNVIANLMYLRAKTIHLGKGAGDTITLSPSSDLGRYATFTLKTALDVTYITENNITSTLSGARVEGVEVVNVEFPNFGTIIMFDGPATLNTKGGTFVLGDGGQTINTSGPITVTGGAGIDTINLTSDYGFADKIIAFGSSINAIDTVSNFKASGADTFKTGTAASSLTSLKIATASLDTLITAIQSGITASGQSLSQTSQAFLITVDSGSAQGYYAFQNTGTNINNIDGSDFIVKLTGKIGTISSLDFIA